MVDGCPAKGRHHAEERYIDAYFHNPVRHFLDAFPGVMIEPCDESCHDSDASFMDGSDCGFVVLDLILPFVRVGEAFLVERFNAKEYTDASRISHHIQEPGIFRDV